MTFELGVEAYMKGNFPAAREFFGQIHTAEAEFNIAMTFTTTGCHEAAELLYSQAISSDSKFIIAYFQRAQSQFFNQKYTEAIRTFTKCATVFYH
jgi:tetratricopeptide (TPR) repeat protein